MSLGHLQQIGSSGIQLCWQLRYFLARLHKTDSPLGVM